MTAEAKLRETIELEVKQLGELAATSTDPCLVAQFIACSDPKVQEVIIKKLSHQYVFRGMSCLTGPSIPEQSHVLFNFECPPGMFCLINPSFLVTVDMIARKVINITDPYLGAGVGASANRGTTSQLPFALARPSRASSVVVPMSQISPMRAKEHAFLQEHGAVRRENTWTSETTPTNCPTAEATTTTSPVYDHYTGTTNQIIDDGSTHYVIDKEDDEQSGMGHLDPEPWWP